MPDPARSCPQDRVNRQFKADRPNTLSGADFTDVSTWQGHLYVAFVIDVFARRIVDSKVSSHMRTDFVLDALEMGLRNFPGAIQLWAWAYAVIRCWRTRPACAVG